MDVTGVRVIGMSFGFVMNPDTFIYRPVVIAIIIEMTNGNIAVFPVLLNIGSCCEIPTVRIDIVVCLAGSPVNAYGSKEGVIHRSIDCNSYSIGILFGILRLHRNGHSSFQRPLRKTECKAYEDGTCADEIRIRADSHSLASGS